MLVYYARLQESYGWTMYEVDEHEIKFLLDQLEALQIADASKEQKFYIDDLKI